ncbi:type III restriction endonuclease subunit M, partial [Mycoplasma flocculare]|nr:type III restriction endonuclease subunit M [Mesomycoplasma flocculare]
NSNQNTLIIGENYDGLKNLLVIERERERERERRLWYNLYRSAL